MSKRSISTAILNVIIILFATCCTKRIDNIVKSKVFLLTPQSYLDQKVTIVGTIIKYGTANSSFIFEDETGKISVTLEKLPEKFECPIGNLVTVFGSLKIMPEVNWYYFSADHLPICAKTTGTN